MHTRQISQGQMSPAPNTTACQRCQVDQARRRDSFAQRHRVSQADAAVSSRENTQFAAGKHKQGESHVWISCGTVHAAATHAHCEQRFSVGLLQTQEALELV